MREYVIDKRALPVQDGFDLRAELVPDYDSTPEDSDCYTATQKTAWEHDEWSYVGIIVTASREGIDLGSASIWGTEYGDYVMTDEENNVTGREWLDPLKDAPGFTIGTPNGNGGYDYETPVTFGNGYGIDLVNEALDEARATVAKIANHPAEYPQEVAR